MSHPHTIPIIIERDGVEVVTLRLCLSCATDMMAWGGSILKPGDKLLFPSDPSTNDHPCEGDACKKMRTGGAA